MSKTVGRKDYKLTKAEVKALPKLKVDSKYLKFPYKYIKPIKIFGNSIKWNMVFKCCCSDYFYMTSSKLSYLLNNDGLEDANCGCIGKNNENIRIEEARSTYYKKESKSDSNPHWCTYCESYRPRVKQVSKNSSYCDNCVFIQSRKIRIGKSFDEVMEDWNPECHNGRYKRLPYLKGNSTKGYEVAGFTYIDADYYNIASKWLWIKVKHYVKTSFSKDNLDRVGLQHCYKVLKDRKHKSVFLHRFVLGLGNDVNLVGDHISGVKLDNRFENLRAGTMAENSYNSRSNKNKTGFVGVSYYPNIGNKQYRARVEKQGRHYVKYYTTLEAAARGYDELLRKLRPSEYNRYNFPKDGELSAIK